MVKFTPGDTALGIVIHTLTELCSSVPATSAKSTSDEIGYRLIFGSGAPEIVSEGGQSGDCEGEELLRGFGQLLTSLAGESNLATSNYHLLNDLTLYQFI